MNKDNQITYAKKITKISNTLISLSKNMDIPLTTEVLALKKELLNLAELAIETNDIILKEAIKNVN